MLSIQASSASSELTPSVCTERGRTSNEREAKAGLPKASLLARPGRISACAAAAMHVLVTGGSGYLGQFLVRSQLHERRCLIMCCMR